MAVPDGLSDLSKGSATNEAALTISDAAFAVPYGSAILFSDSNPFLEEEKNPCSGSNTPPQGDFTPVFHPSPLSDFLGEGNGGNFPPIPFPPPHPPGGKTPQNSPKTPPKSGLASPASVGEVNRSPSPSPTLPTSFPSPLSTPTSPLLWGEDPLEDESKNPAGLSLESYQDRKKAVVLYLEKAPRQNKLHALVGCLDENTEKRFFRIPIEDFSSPPPAQEPPFFSAITRSLAPAPSGLK